MKFFQYLAGVCVAAIGFAGSGAIAQTSSPLILTRPGGAPAHVFPTYQAAKQLGMVRTPGAPPPATPLLIYHGGPIMQPALSFFVIYWAPPTLQDGTPTSISTGYQKVLNAMVGGYPGHALASIASQYYEGSAPKTYITGTGALAQVVNDPHPYPVSGCAASIGANCITDAQLQAEVQRLIGVKGWTGGLDRMYLVFTAPGEGSCFTTSTAYCSTETANVSPYYCAYHSYISGAQPIIYSNEPNGSSYWCLGSGTQPNAAQGGDGVDPAATAASHEMSEAITDPLLNAWYASDGSENGDLCAYNYLTNTWDGGKANQKWNGAFFELQSEYSNHHARCELVGP